jgi:hypothetical protein
MVGTTIAGIAYAQSEPPPTIDPGPILLLLVVVAVAYFVVSHIREILTFIAFAFVLLMILGVFYLRDMLSNASGVPPAA